MFYWGGLNIEIHKENLYYDEKRSNFQGIARHRIKINSIVKNNFLEKEKNWNVERRTRSDFIETDLGSGAHLPRRRLSLKIQNRLSRGEISIGTVFLLKFKSALTVLVWGEVESLVKDATSWRYLNSIHSGSVLVQRHFVSREHNEGSRAERYLPSVYIPFSPWTPAQRDFWFFSLPCALPNLSFILPLTRPRIISAAT